MISLETSLRSLLAAVALTGAVGIVPVNACALIPFDHWVAETTRAAEARPLPEALRGRVDGLLAEARDTATAPWHGGRERALREARRLLDLDVSSLKAPLAELAPEERQREEQRLAVASLGDLDALVREGRRDTGIGGGEPLGVPRGRSSIADLRAEAVRLIEAERYSDATMIIETAEMRLGAVLPHGCGR